MKQILPIIAIIFFLASCGTNKNAVDNTPIEKTDTTKRMTFNRIIKSSDYNLKYEKAREYYDAEKYLKALDLYEQLVPFYRGQTRGAEVYFMYCMSNYQSGDYLYAGYHFKSFYTMYPYTPFAEQALFLSAYCYYLDSPRWSLDQEPTTDAISQFQLFLSKFPKSNLVDSCNNLVDTLRYKLEEKSFRAAKLYYDMGYFSAATIALNNSIKDFPDSHFREEIYYYIAKSDMKYADGSIYNKQKLRYTQASNSCKKYIKIFPQGNYIKEIIKIQEQADKNLAKMK
ncbi:MAG: outer membrane protein assembly factor BamD [Bacteroidales bacterium]|nr:outer membrane protein assembly factor BamD [Bacteroidales bacterium]